MDEEKQRIKIAEACGYKYSESHGWFKKDGVTYYLGYEDIISPQIPDYLHDLNAMADAIAYLTPEQIDTFAIELSAIVLENPSKAWWDLNANEVGHVITATAAQQAEAFLKTLGLWEE
jgi:hypothetical protein